MKNSFINGFTDIVVLRVKTKNMDRFLNSLYKLNIDIFNVEVKNYKEVIVEVYEKDLNKIRKLSILNKIEIIDYKGKIKRKNKLLFNKIFILSLFFGLFLLFFLTSIIYDIEVIHTSSEIRSFILSELEEKGIKKYQLRKNYNKLSDIKNKILKDNKNKLEWLEIERIGTKYVIKLEERKINNIITDYKYQDIVATHDAVIKKIVADSGVKVKEVNEYVKKGDTIISGSIYLNEEIKEITKALGEIYGEVWYKISVEYPIINVDKRETGNKNEVFSINFFNNSFILFNKNPYKNSNIKRKYILKNNILPISISKDTLYELTDFSGIYVEGEALINAVYYGRRKIEDTLRKDEYIISEKVLNYSQNSNTIYVDIFYKIYKNITGTKEIIIEEGG